MNSEEPRTTFAATNITVREFFAQYDDAVRDTMKKRSLETYRDIARLHLLPAFGNKKLKDLFPSTLLLGNRVNSVG